LLFTLSTSYFEFFISQSYTSSHYFFFKLKNSGLFNLFLLSHIAGDSGYKVEERKIKKLDFEEAGFCICLGLAISQNPCHVQNKAKSWIHPVI